jgi:hypothetical protein
LARVTEQKRKIDKLLKLSRADWEEPPHILSELDEWSPNDLMSYAAELPLWNDRLYQLDRYAEQGLMSEGQARKHRELRELVARNRPILDQILRS